MGPLTGQTQAFVDVPAVVLVVDSDEASRAQVEDAVGAAGFQVVGVAEALAAKEAAAKIKPRVIVVAEQLPTLDAVALLRDIGCLGPEAAAVALSRSPTMDRVFALMRQGAVEVLRRPLDRSLLAAAVRRAAAIVGRRQPIPADRWRPPEWTASTPVGAATAPLDPALSQLRDGLKSGEIGIPAVPTLVRDLRLALHDPRKSVGDLARIIERDQSLAGNVLRLSNTVAYARGGRVNDVTTAVSRIGLKPIEGMLETIFLRNCYQPRSARSKALIAEIWRYAVGQALAMRILVENTHGAPLDAGLAYIAGLLSDVGAALLVWLVDSRASDLPEEIWMPFLRDHHESLGSQVLTQWGILPSIVQTAASHHAPGPPVTASLYWSVAAVAGELADAVVGGGDITRPFLRSPQSVGPCADALRIDATMLRTAEDELHKGFDEILKILG